MDEERALRAAICANSKDDTPRLVYADWLQENGLVERAEFIRLQIALERGNYHFPGIPTGKEAMEARERALLRADRDEWEAPLRALGVARVEFRRGLPAAVCVSLDDFLANHAHLFELAPITSLSFSGNSFIAPDDARALARSPNLSKLEYLNLSCKGLGNAGARALARSPNLRNLTGLDLSGNHIAPNGARALAQSPNLVGLTCLHLPHNRIGDEGVQALARGLRNLTSLNLSGNDIGLPGARALAESPHLANLTHLDLRWNRIGDEGVQALATSPYLTNLRSLDLGGNDIGAVGVRALVAPTSRLTNLTQLDLSDNPIGNAVRHEIERTMEERRPGRPR
ncbi:MAG: hypothetical protein C0501_21350 [Isosphaera sp.]|nr:hypothetical protein [Isosphaera sp.]